MQLVFLNCKAELKKKKTQNRWMSAYLQKCITAVAVRRPNCFNFVMCKCEH